jgi:hypothetical protein
MNLQDIMSNKPGDEKQRYRDYVIETQSRGDTPLPFKEWYQLQQKTNG